MRTVILLLAAVCAAVGAEDAAPAQPQAEREAEEFAGTVVSIDPGRSEVVVRVTRDGETAAGDERTLVADAQTRIQSGQQDLRVEQLQSGDRVTIRVRPEARDRAITIRVLVGEDPTEDEAEDPLGAAGDDADDAVAAAEPYDPLEHRALNRDSGIGGDDDLVAGGGIGDDPPSGTEPLLGEDDDQIGGGIGADADERPFAERDSGIGGDAPAQQEDEGRDALPQYGPPADEGGFARSDAVEQGQD